MPRGWVWNVCGDGEALGYWELDLGLLSVIVEQVQKEGALYRCIELRVSVWDAAQTELLSKKQQTWRWRSERAAKRFAIQQARRVLLRLLKKLEV